MTNEASLIPLKTDQSRKVGDFRRAGGRPFDIEICVGESGSDEKVLYGDCSMNDRGSPGL